MQNGWVVDLHVSRRSSLGLGETHGEQYEMLRMLGSSVKPRKLNKADLMQRKCLVLVKSGTIRDEAGEPGLSAVERQQRWRQMGICTHCPV